MKKKPTVIHVNIVISFIIVLLFCYKNRHHPLILNLCNGFFVLGLIYFCIALSVHIRNSGLFKSLTYFKYRRNKNNLKKQISQENPTASLPENFNTFYDYITDKYREQWNYKVFYVISLPSFALSFIFLFIYYN